MTKTCGTCGRTLPIESFNKHRRAKDGRRGYCKDCHVGYNIEFGHNHVSQANYRARSYGAPGILTIGTWNDIRIKQGDKCNLCQDAPIAFLDHIVPLSQAGSNRPHNIEGICRQCNTRKNANERRAAVVHGRKMKKAA